MIIENNPFQLSKKEELIAEKIIIKSFCQNGHRYHSYFGVGWDSTGMETRECNSGILIYTWHRWPRNGLDNFPSEVPTMEVAETLIKREFANRFIRDTKRMLNELYSDTLEGELPLLCSTEIPWSDNNERAWELATDFAVTLLEGNPLSAIKELIP